MRESAGTRGVWISGLTALALFAVLAWYLAPLEPGVLALQLAGTPRGFGQIVHAWSAADLARYRSHLPVDYVLLTAYGVFGYLAGTRTGVFAALGATHRRAATWLLPAAALFDAVENALHWWLTEAPRFGVPLAYALSAGFSWLKWMSIVAFLLICARAVARAGD